MTDERKNQIYILKDKDWKPLAELVRNDIEIKDDVTIYQLFSADSKGQHYAILSLSEKADKIIKEYGGTTDNVGDVMKEKLKNYYKKPLYGDKKNANFI